MKLKTIKGVLKFFRAHRSIPNTGDKRKVDRTTAHTEKLIFSLILVVKKGSARYT